MSIENNVTIGHRVTEAWGLAADVASELPDDNCVEQFWARLADRVAEQAGKTKQPYEPDSPMTDEASRQFGNQIPFEFGKHQGTTTDEIPLDYLEWYSETSIELARKIRRYLRSDRVKRERYGENERDEQWQKALDSL